MDKEKVNDFYYWVIFSFVKCLFKVNNKNINSLIFFQRLYYYLQQIQHINLVFLLLTLRIGSNSIDWHYKSNCEEHTLNILQIVLVPVTYTLNVCVSFHITYLRRWPRSILLWVKSMFTNRLPSFKGPTIIDPPKTPKRN